jgi:hypothetical protein
VLLHRCQGSSIAAYVANVRCVGKCAAAQVSREFDYCICCKGSVRIRDMGRVNQSTGIGEAWNAAQAGGEYMFLRKG